jgi:ubiquinone/menaquinone biosynthesis C-methylase UbiE
VSETDPARDVAARSRGSATVARRYDRIAFLYDLYDAPMERLGGERRRKRLLAQARGRVLEVGIGTGLNLPLYPSGVRLTGLDISARMLARAVPRATDLKAALVRGDVERLPFPDHSFDTVVATCVFCSVADPVAGLRELARVVEDEGKILLLEHVRPTNPVLGLLADLATPLTRRLMGPALNRRTEENAGAAGIRLLSVRREAIWREMIGAA